MKLIIDDKIVLSRPLEGPLAPQVPAFAKWGKNKGTRDVPGTGKFSLLRVSADGLGSEPSACDMSLPSIRLSIYVHVRVVYRSIVAMPQR